LHNGFLVFKRFEEGDHVSEGVGDEMREEYGVMIVLKGVGEGEAALLFVLVHYRVDVSWVKVEV